MHTTGGKRVQFALGRLVLGLLLIALASSVLLLSDAGRRRESGASRHPGVSAEAQGSSPGNTVRAVAPAMEGRDTQSASPWKVNLLKYVEIDDSEEAERGVLAGLQESGLVEGRDYEVTSFSANGDMATVSGLVDASVTQGADLLITLSTPTLQAALNRAGSIPVVFSFVANPIIAGAGSSDEHHLPNVTGVYMHGAYGEVIAALKECLPSARTVGTLFVPAEVNTVYHTEMVTKIAREAGIDLISVPVTSSTDIADAAVALCSHRLDALVQVGGNLVGSSFGSISRAARQAGLPVFGFMTSQAQQGAAVVVARDYYEGGREAAQLAVRVIRGESPAELPFQPLRATTTIVNLEAAQASGLTIPQSLIQRADQVLGQDPGAAGHRH